MKTQLLSKTKELTPAVRAIQEGQAIGVPTETVYGLCVNGLNESAVKMLYDLKGRPEVKPLSLMVPDFESALPYVHDVPPAAQALAERFWPGPLTIILPAQTDKIPSVTRAGGDTVGLRCPDSPLTLELLRQCRVPLAGPSANPSGQPSPHSADEVLAYFEGQIPCIIDGGECSVGIESTILTLATTPYRILRQGGLSAEDIQSALVDSMTIFGLTGGTGTGKTTVLQALEARGALALDCDQIYHELLDTDTGLLQELRQRFGEGVFQDAKLNRKALGQIVFQDPWALADLNTITHRYVALEIQRRLKEHAVNGGRYAVIDAVELISAGLNALCDLTVGVIASTKVRQQRIMAREGISADYALSRIAAQKDNDYYQSHCDQTITNDGTIEELNNQISNIFGGYFHG